MYILKHSILFSISLQFSNVQWLGSEKVTYLKTYKCLKDCWSELEFEYYVLMYTRKSWFYFFKRLASNF